MVDGDNTAKIFNLNRELISLGLYGISKNLFITTRIIFHLYEKIITVKQTTNVYINLGPIFINIRDLVFGENLKNVAV